MLEGAVDLREELARDTELRSPPTFL